MERGRAFAGRMVCLIRMVALRSTSKRQICMGHRHGFARPDNSGRSFRSVGGDVGGYAECGHGDCDREYNFEVGGPISAVHRMIHRRLRRAVSILPS